MTEVYVRPNVNAEDPRNQRAAHAQKTDSRLNRSVQKRQIRERISDMCSIRNLLILHFVFVTSSDKHLCVITYLLCLNSCPLLFF